MTALSSGHLFYELRLLLEFSEISFTLIHACLLKCNEIICESYETTVSVSIICRNGALLLIHCLGMTHYYDVMWRHLSPELTT